MGRRTALAMPYVYLFFLPLANPTRTLTVRRTRTILFGHLVTPSFCFLPGVVLLYYILHHQCSRIGFGLDDYIPFVSAMGDGTNE